MGCPCRQIRAALSHLPGGKFLVGLLPALPPKGPQMKMLARVAGQSFNLAHGPHYRADDDRVIYVETGDVAEMRRLGCTDAPADEPTPAPVAQIEAEPEPPAGSLEELAASLPASPATES
jgi:hypothetical protein